MKNEIEQGLHEKLCAYVLGEASEDVRAEIEAALERDAELRAEKERLEQTIGLVQETLGGTDAAPAISAEEILAEAREARRRPWYARPAFRAAAGIAAVTWLGVVGYRAMLERDSQRARPVAADVRKLDESKYRLAERNEPAARDEKDPAAIAVKSEAAAAPSSAEASKKLAAVTADASAKAKRPIIDSATLGQLDERSPPGVDEFREEFVDRSQATTLPAEPSLDDSDTAGHYSGMSSVGISAARSAPAAKSSAASPSASGARKLEMGRAASAPSPTRVDPNHGDDFFLSAPKSQVAKESGNTTQRFAGLGYVGEERVDSGLTNMLGKDAPGFAGEGGVSRDDLSVVDRLRQLDPADRDRWIENECQQIVRRCRRLPNEKPRDMFFRFYGDNPFEVTALDAQSTFSVDVDTASYALARRYLNEGHIPEKAQVRTEEFVNYFKPDVAHPTQGTFSIHTDLTPSRFSADKQRSMLRVVVSGREVSKVERKPLNLTFVIDVSGSMREQNRLEMVKHAIRLLVNELGGGDNLAIVAFSNDARIVLPMTSVRNRSEIESALFPLQPENSTNSESGLKLGYQIALANINPEAQNRVVFLSDGVANIGETDPAKLSETVRPIREKGVYLNTIGVGMNNHNDVLLEQLADKGDGVCNYIDSQDEAKRVIVDGFTGAFETIARDEKIQVEFDPAQVERYRLLGYENRAIADKDFRNDKIDAGEVGAGHQVTALYELELVPGASLAPSAPEKLGGLGYLDGPRTPAAAAKPLAVVRLRWKAPRSVSAPTANEEATEIAQPVFARSQTSFEGAGVGYRRAVVVAQFAEFLRRSIHARGESLDDLISEADKLEKETHDPDTGELVLLLHKSKSLILAALPKCDDLCDAIESLRRRELLRCELSQLEREQDRSRLEDLEKQNLELEQRIRDLLRKKLESR